MYCTAPRQLRILPLLDEGDSIPILISTTGFQPFPPLTATPCWRLAHLGTRTRFIVADSIRNLEQEDGPQ